jgi:hypothetical protein
MKKLISTLLFALVALNCQASLFDKIIGEECPSSIPVWVVKKTITHESKSFYQSEVQPWPWTLNINGVGHYYQTMKDAVIAAKNAHREGARRLGVGFGQVEWVYHSERFNGSFENALNPKQNVKVVCEILVEAWRSPKVNTWEDAIAYYHRPVLDKIARSYAEKVLSL